MKKIIIITLDLIFVLFCMEAFCQYKEPIHIDEHTYEKLQQHTSLKFQPKNDFKNANYSKNKNLGNSPNWNWIKQFGGKGGTYANDVAIDLNGNIYVVGYFNGTSTFNTITLNSVGLWDLFIMKCDTIGNPLWVKQLSCSVNEDIIGNGIALDNIGNIYVSGYYNGVFQSIPSNGKDGFVIKCDNSGTIIWTNFFGGADDQVGTKIITDASGYPYCIGFIYASTNFGLTNSYLTKLDPISHASIWTVMNGAIYYDLLYKGSNIYVTGQIINPTYFGTTYLTPYVAGDPFVAKADLNGNFIWASKGNSNYKDLGQSVAVDNLNNVYLSGNAYYDDIYFGNDTIQVTSYPNYIVKFNSSGTYQWLRQVGTNIDYKFTDIIIDTNNSPLLIGYASDKFTYLGTQIEVGGFIAKFDANGNPLEIKNQKASSSSIISSNNIFQTGVFNNNTFLLKSDLNDDPVWYKETSGDGGSSNVWYQLHVDKSGNIYSQGMISGVNNFNGTTLTGNGAYFAKYKGNGDLMWIKQFHSKSYRVDDVQPSGTTCDNNGNSYCWGTFNDSLTIDGNILVPSKGNSSYLAKYDSSGNFQWVKQMNCTSTLIGVGGITVDISGNIIIIGNFTDTLQIATNTLINDNYQNFFLAKYSPTGTVLWAKKFNSSQNNWGRGISTDLNNNIYITGGTKGINFGLTSITSMGSYDVFIAKLDSNGNEIWANSAGGISNDRAYNIVADSLGNAYLSGFSTSSPIYFDGITISPPQGNQSMFIVKYNSFGIAQWARYLTSTFTNYMPAYQIGIDNEGSCYIGGNYADSLFFDSNQIFTGGWGNMFVAKYLSNGTIDWAKNIVDTKYSQSLLDGLSVFGKDNIVVGGRTYGIINFDNFQISTASENGFIALLGNSLLTNINNFSENKIINIFPNPTLNNLTIESPQNSSIEIINIHGQIIKTLQTTKDKTSVDVSALPGGIYLVEVKTEEGVAVKKFIKE